jgi:hypothetical protein
MSESQFSDQQFKVGLTIIDYCRDHSTHFLLMVVRHVVGDMAMERPDARIIGHKFDVRSFARSDVDSTIYKLCTRCYSIAV